MDPGSLLSPLLQILSPWGWPSWGWGMAPSVWVGWAVLPQLILPHLAQSETRRTVTGSAVTAALAAGTASAGAGAGIGATGTSGVPPETGGDEGTRLGTPGWVDGWASVGCPGLWHLSIWVGSLARVSGIQFFLFGVPCSSWRVVGAAGS